MCAYNMKGFKLLYYGTLNLSGHGNNNNNNIATTTIYKILIRGLPLRAFALAN